MFDFSHNSQVNSYHTNGLSHAKRKALESSIVLEANEQEKNRMSWIVPIAQIISSWVKLYLQLLLVFREASMMHTLNEI